MLIPGRCHQNQQKKGEEVRYQRWKSMRNLQKIWRVFRWQEREGGKRWWTGKTECGKGIKEETSKSWLQMRTQRGRERVHICLERCGWAWNGWIYGVKIGKTGAKSDEICRLCLQNGPGSTQRQTGPGAACTYRAQSFQTTKEGGRV